MKFAPLLLLFLLPALASAQEPVLSWNTDPIPLLSNAASSSRLYKFKGLLIRHTLRTSLYPILPYVFFDSGSASIPSRYVQYDSAEQTGTFSEKRLHGGALDRYPNILNILGSRLREFPTVRIKLQGECSNEPLLGETGTIATARATLVANYLTRVWGIAPDRIATLPWRAHPYYISKDPNGRADQRHVHIIVDDPAGEGYPIMRPSAIVDLQNDAQPARIRFSVGGYPEAMPYRSRTIQIRRGSVVWNTVDIPSRPNTVIEWDWRNRNGELPQGEQPFTAQLLLEDTNGSVHSSRLVEIPVEILTLDEQSTPRIDDSHPPLCPLVFEYDSPKLGSLNERILSEFVYPFIYDKSDVTAVGHTDLIGLEDRNLMIARKRAEAVISGVKQNVKTSYGKLTAQGVGEEESIYTHALPEGRFYNRTVIVSIVTP